MSHKINKRPRVKRDHSDKRAIDLLSKIYEFDRRLTFQFYKHFKKEISVTKLHLKLMADSRAELDFIDSINLSY